jgi:hypothetical protein
MKVYKIALFAILLGFTGIFAAFAADAYLAPGVEFNIRFYDRKIYYASGDPVSVQITITNKSPDTFRFKLADERAFSVDFDIRSMTNRKLSDSEILIRKRNQHQQIYFREIAIESGEAFSFVEDIRDYVSINQAGSYRVKARMYPELFRTASSPVYESNYLALSLRPPAIPGPDGIPLAMDVDTGAILVRQSIPPDEVVSYMIRARQDSQWERFFLYLDLEAMLSREAAQRRKFLAENEEGRQRMIIQYRENLKNSVIDGDISVIPTSFEILETKYNNNEGTVVVLARFREITFTYLRRYTYDLVRADNIWMIVNYTVQSLGTEGN